MAKTTRAAGSKPSAKTSTSSSTTSRTRSRSGKSAEARPTEMTDPGKVMAQTLEQLHHTVEDTVDPLGMSAPMVHAQLAWLTPGSAPTCSPSASTCASSMSHTVMPLAW